MNFALMAAMVCGLSLAVTSCKDDKNDGGGSSQTAEEQAAENAETFWSVAAGLVSPFDVTDEYEDKTFEPTIGMVENPYLYNNNLVPMINYMLRNNYQQSLIFLDNQPYQSDYKF